MGTSPAWHSPPTVWRHRRGSSLSGALSRTKTRTGGTRCCVEALAGTRARAQPWWGALSNTGEGAPLPQRVRERPLAPRAPTGAGARASHWLRRRRGPFPLPASSGPHPPPRRPLSRLRRVPARTPTPRASAPPPPPPTFRATAARSRAQVAGALEPPRGRAAGLLSFPTTPHPAALVAWGGRARAGGSPGRAPRPRLQSLASAAAAAEVAHRCG